MNLIASAGPVRTAKSSETTMKGNFMTSTPLNPIPEAPVPRGRR